MSEDDEYKVDIYKTETGKEPFVEWKDSLDINTCVRIDTRVNRIRSTGNFGDCEPLEDGVFELRFHFGAGYRIYFGFKDTKKKHIILLDGGSKNGQSRDIKKAKKYWENYISRLK